MCVDCNLKNAVLAGVLLFEANLISTDLSGANLESIQTGRATFSAERTVKGIGLGPNLLYR